MFPFLELQKRFENLNLSQNLINKTNVNKLKHENDKALKLCKGIRLKKYRDLDAGLDFSDFDSGLDSG